MYISGINPLDSYPYGVLEAPVPFLQGDRGKDGEGREYVFCSTVVALTLGDLVMLPLGNVVGTIALVTSGAIYNRQVGVSRVTFAANALGTGFWAQVQGATTARASVASTVNVPAYTTATAGAASTTLTASNLIRGLTFTTTPTGAGVFAALLNYPTVGNVADTDLP